MNNLTKNFILKFKPKYQVTKLVSVLNQKYNLKHVGIQNFRFC